MPTTQVPHAATQEAAQPATAPQAAVEEPWVEYGREPLVMTGEIVGAMQYQGYRRGLPPGITPETWRAEVEVAKETECPHCGQVGMGFAPLWASNPVRWVGVYSCPACGHGFR